MAKQTIIYEAHLIVSNFSNPYQCRQILHDVAFTGTTFVVRVQATDLVSARIVVSVSEQVIEPSYY